jgi:hypothetical protein
MWWQGIAMEADPTGSNSSEGGGPSGSYGQGRWAMWWHSLAREVGGTQW